MYLLRISEVEDEAENRHFGGLQSRSGASQLLLLHNALTGHEHQTTSHTSEHGGVVGHGQRSSIDNHVIVLGEGLLDHFLHEIGVQQNAGVSRALAGRHDVQVRLPILLNDIGRGRLARQHVRQAHVAFNAELVSHGRVAQIGVDKQHALAFLGESHGNVGGNRGLTFGRISGGDDQQSAMTLRGGGGKERQVRADAAEFLSLATSWLSDYDRAAVVKNRSLWHSTQRRSVGQLTHIIGGVHLGVEDVLQQGNANAYDEAENQARGQIQRNVRGALPGRSLSLLHYRELDGRAAGRGVVVQVGRNLIGQVLRHAVGDVGRLLRIADFRRDVHHERVRGVRSGHHIGKIGRGHIQTEVLNDGLEHGFGLHQFRIRLDLGVQIIGTRAHIVGGLRLAGLTGIRGEHFSRSRVLRRHDERDSCDRSKHHHKRDDRRREMLANNLQQISDGQCSSLPLREIFTDGL